MPIRALFVSEKYPPIVGGGETHLQQLAEGLVAHGYEVTVCTDREVTGSAENINGVKILTVPGLKAACRDLRCYESLKSLHSIFADERYDLVHVVNYVPALLLLWLKPLVRTPIFMSTFETFIAGERVFGMFDDFDLEDSLRRSVAAALRPDIVFCGSAAYRRWAISAGFDEQTLRVIPFATDIDRFSFSLEARTDFRAARGWADDEFVFFIPARPVPRKRIEDAISALHRIRSSGPVRLMLTRPTDRFDRTYVDQLKNQVDRENLNALVTWECDASWTDMPILYSACDAVVLPSSHEGFGISLIEAMAASRPVISTSIEGPADLVAHETTGLTYRSGDVENLAECMLRVAQTDMSAMVERALSNVLRTHSLPAMVAAYIQVHRNLGGLM